jgi:hypothetical protein
MRRNTTLTMPYGLGPKPGIQCSITRSLGLTWLSSGSFALLQFHKERPVVDRNVG